MFPFPKHIKIISGGQSGVDHAVLDFALKHEIPCGGWCPKGRIAEDGKISNKYPLQETTTSEYSERTEMNILNSDATLVIHSLEIDDGTKLTIELCSKYNKPLFELILQEETRKPGPINWIKENNVQVINIAGPRESNAPGIYKKTLAFLNQYNQL